MIRPFDLTIHGTKLSMLLDIEPGRYYSDDALTHYLDNRMCPEPELVHVLFRALKPGDLAVDAGANVGFFTIVMSKLVGPKGKVIAIEPDSRNLAMLRKNLDINECGNIEVLPFALGSRRYTSSFHQSEENGQSSLFGDTNAEVTVETLDKVFLRLPKHARLLKLDIEGSETDALRGFEDRAVPYIVSEVNPDALKRADSSPEELREELYYRGYFPYVLHETGALPSLVDARQRLKIMRPNTNMLFCSTKDLVALWPEVEL